MARSSFTSPYNLEKAYPLRCPSPTSAHPAEPGPSASDAQHQGGPGGADSDPDGHHRHPSRGFRHRAEAVGGQGALHIGGGVQDGDEGHCQVAGTGSGQSGYAFSDLQGALELYHADGIVDACQVAHEVGKAAEEFHLFSDVSLVSMAGSLLSVG